MGKYSDALWCLEKSLTIMQKSLPPDNPSLANTYGYIGSVYQEMGEYSTLRPYLKKTLEIQLESLPPDHSEFAIIYSNIASL
jgi:tetratricopeptide (TPR) repeat protein